MEQSYYQKNRGKILNRTKLYYKENRGNILKYQVQYSKENKEKISKRNLEWRKKNKNSLKEKKKQEYIINAEKIKERTKNWYKNNQDRVIKYYEIYYSKNKEKIIKRNLVLERKKYYSNINFRLKHVLRRRLYAAIKNDQKTGSAVKDLGCSIEYLKKHLESQFTEGMSWNNYGVKGWHIDHIIPLAYFDLTKEKDFKQACHYTNLQPLWAVDNIKKGSKLMYNI